MDINQAIEHANAFVIPGLLVDDQSIIGEVNKNCDAIKTLLDAWKEAPLGQEPVEFSVIQQLADRTRSLCDTYGVERLRNHRGVGLSRGLSNDDLAAAVAKMQRRRPKAVFKTAGPLLNDLHIAYVEKSVSGTILGIDIETTSRFPELGYIVNVGFEFWNLGRNTVAVEPHTAYFGIPEMYKEKGVPLADIHQITWKDVEGKKSFRDDKKAQEALLATMKKIPFMAHNAAFEDSWFMFNIDGYAEARKAGKIIVIDSRDICRRLDPEIRSLPRESSPAALENWARRRHTLAADEKERHLGLEDVDLMIRTVQAEFADHNMFED